MDQSVIDAIDEGFKLIGAKKINYPQFVDHLLAAGVTRYTVDVATHRITFYGTGGEAHVRQGPALDHDPRGNYDIDRIKAAITDAQKEKIDHITFLKRIYAAGVMNYESNLRSREIRYRGESMSYREDIPVAGAAPKPAPKPAPKAAAKPVKKKKNHRINVANSLKARKAAKRRNPWKKGR